MTDRDADGMRVRRAVLGDAHVDRATAAADAFTTDFQHFITRNVWGDVWGRPGLDRHTRSMVTVAVLTALRAEAELELHLRAALRNGVTTDEIKEVLLHVAAYAGVPASNSAFALASRVLREEGALPAGGPAPDDESARHDGDAAASG
ncbi:MAG TPA: 4-carboxymuconolactone decarboxylase [Micromonosporaceae bacterium]|nr:4-carboxymuconolactone decarboxylase [Micromonosporaceae bacterium]